MFNYTLIPSTGQKFYQKGERPELLIVSGTHGDEYEVVPIVEEMVVRYEKKLPDFLYVPEVSPSALVKHTHANKDGLNVNRQFFSGTKCEEALEMMNIWKHFRFQNFVSFHEDPERQDEFYLYAGMKAEDYDSLRLEGKPQYESLMQDITGLGVKLYNGIDDTADPDLGYMVKDGYVHWPMDRNDHSSDYWLIVENDYAMRVINPEIPGKIAVDKKQAIVEAIFRRLLLEKS